MALFKQPPVQIDFKAGPHEKIAALQRPIGTLRTLENATFDRDGAISKSRGSTVVDVDDVIGGADADGVYTAIAVHGGRLVLFGGDRMYVVASLDAGVDASSIVRSGPSIRGDYTIAHYRSSSLGDEL